MMFAGDEDDVVGLRIADEAGMAVGQFLGAVLVDLLHTAGIVAPAHFITAAVPALVIAHAVVDHLRMELQEIEVQQGHMVLAAIHLGLDAVTTAGPIEMVGPFAE